MSKNAVSELNEYCQKRGLPMPAFLPSPPSGPSHMPVFHSIGIQWGQENHMLCDFECHSVRELKNEAAQWLLAKAAHTRTLEQRVQQLENNVTSLTEEINQLHHLMQAVLQTPSLRQ